MFIIENDVLIKYNGDEVDVTIPNGIVEIGSQCFSGQIKSVVIPKSVKKIGVFAFGYCVNLEKVVFSEDSDLEIISNFAFSYCDKIKQMALPRKLKTFDKAFNFCQNLRTLDFSNSNLQEVDTMAFVCCSKLTSVNLSNCQNLKFIGDYAFHNCKKLTDVNLENDVNLTFIGDYAFAGCPNLKTINIPDNKIEICPTAFEENTKIDRK